MPARLDLLGSSRLFNVVFVEATLMFCVTASACSGSVDTTAETTSEDTNLPAYASTLQPQIEEQMTNLRIPGALVYVHVAGEGSWSQAFGTGTLGANTPITPDNHFHIGSNTRH